MYHILGITVTSFHFPLAKSHASQTSKQMNLSWKGRTPSALSWEADVGQLLRIRCPKSPRSPIYSHPTIHTIHANHLITLNIVNDTTRNTQNSETTCFWVALAPACDITKKMYKNKQMAHINKYRQTIIACWVPRSDPHAHHSTCSSSIAPRSARCLFIILIFLCCLIREFFWYSLSSKINCINNKMWTI